MNILTEFFIVNHGEAEWNAKGLVQGHADLPLTERGTDQVKTLSEKLRHIQFDEAFSSDLVRAKQTAEILALEKKLMVKATHLLRERSYGILEGTKLDEFHDLYLDWEAFSNEQKWNHKLANEESHYESLMRFVTFIRELAVGYPAKTILVVAHDSLMRSFLIAMGYGDWSKIGGFIECGYIHVASDGIDFFLREARGVKQWQDIATG